MLLLNRSIQITSIQKLKRYNLVKLKRLSTVTEEEHSEKEVGNKRASLPLSWLQKTHGKYKPWADKSKLGSEYIYDNWCAQDLTINSLYGAKGHLKTSETHVRK